MTRYPCYSVNFSRRFPNENLMNYGRLPIISNHSVSAMVASDVKESPKTSRSTEENIRNSN
jgi:hypothetical protein